jgi:hypothetical protein
MLFLVFGFFFFLHETQALRLYGGWLMRQRRKHCGFTMAG